VALDVITVEVGRFAHFPEKVGEAGADSLSCFERFLRALVPKVPGKVGLNVIINEAGDPNKKGPVSLNNGAAGAHKEGG